MSTNVMNMNIPSVGSVVRVTTIPTVYGWDDLEPTPDVYEGTVVPNEKWDRPNTFCMTGDKYIRVRSINMKFVGSVEIISGLSRKVDISGFRAFKVESKGKAYIVGIQSGKFVCNCTGFSYRKTCSHSQAVAKRVMQ